MPDPYLTPRNTTEHEIDIKRSRFLCAIGRVASEEEAREFIAGRKRLYGDATHNCSAYVIGGDRHIQRADDDGEPGGTAGTPMLETLLRRGVADVVAVVTRYFGGVKLGAGGLPSRSPSTSAGETLNPPAMNSSFLRSTMARSPRV
ncbi:IMPACT family protein, partial [Streptosporangium sp. NPDC001682]